jgi:hypothetical protein
MNINAYDDRRAQRRRPGSFLALCCFCLVLIGAISLTITLIVLTNPTPPPPPPPPSLVCDGFTDLTEASQPIVQPCDADRLPGACTLVAGVPFISCVIPTTFSGSTDLAGIGIETCVIANNECVSGVCECSARRLCQRELVPQLEGFPRFVDFVCNSPPPPEDPDSACGRLSDVPLVDQPILVDCDEPLVIPGQCTAQGDCRYLVQDDGAATDDDNVPRFCTDVLCTAELQPCTCSQQTGLACQRDVTQPSGVVTTFRMPCADDTVPADNDFELLADELRAMEHQLLARKNK